MVERQGDTDKAIKLCLESLSINVSNGDALETLTVNLTRLYFSTGQLAKAEKCARDAIAMRPNSASLWHQLGLILECAGEDGTVFCPWG